MANKLRGWVSADPLLREKNISASFGIACYPLHGSSPQESSKWPTLPCIFPRSGRQWPFPRRHFDPMSEKWKRDVLEAYRRDAQRLFSTGPRPLKDLPALAAIHRIAGGHEPNDDKLRR